MKPNSHQDLQNMPPKVSTVSDRAHLMWRMQLHSALRSALACAIIGAATIHGPDFLVRRVKFATFSYLTSILIVPDATLGDTFRGCWHAFCATAQVVPLATLVRWSSADPNGNVPIGIAALVAGVGSFLIALPQSTPLMAKRIAFGQIVVLCTDAVVSFDGASPGYMHPLHVAASTAFGALASVLALLVPFPGQYSYKVGEMCRVYTKNIYERINIYMKAFKSENQTKSELIRQVQPINETGSKLIQSIRTLQDGMLWAIPRIKYPKHHILSSEDKLQSMELPLRGIEYSLVSSFAFPVQIIDQERVSNVFDTISDQLHRKIEQARSFPAMNSKTEPETRASSMEQNMSLPLDSVLSSTENSWIFFFFACIDMLLNNEQITSAPTKEVEAERELFSFIIIMRKLKAWFFKLKLEFALKCSLSIGLAVLLGLIFDKNNGIWAGLTIAISFVTGKQAVFTIANTRAQGTAMGSVYAVVCVFLFHSSEMKFLALLVWIIFASFLRHSRMYGQTGATSAKIGAFLILGRKKYGVPTEFAIERLTEVFIGLSCFIVVEFFLQPVRAATLANNHLHVTLRALQDCIKQTGGAKMEFLEVRKKHRNLDSLLCELKQLVKDAELEPSFWFLPFRTCCYNKLVQSLSNIADMLHFITFNVEKLSELQKECDNEVKQVQEHMNSEFELFQETMGSSLKYLERVNLIENRDLVDDTFKDIEVGKIENKGKLLIKEDEVQHRNGEDDAEEDTFIREKIIMYIGALRFCIISMRKEVNESEICIKEIVRWENNSSK